MLVLIFMDNSFQIVKNFSLILNIPLQGVNIEQYSILIDIMKIIGRVVEELIDNWWMIATEDGGILMKCDQKLKLEITYSFIKPDKIDRYKYKSSTIFKPVESKDVVKKI